MIGALLAAGLVAAEPVQGVDDVYEIVVHGDFPVLVARDAIVRELEAMGYRHRSRGDRIVFRPPEPWMGRARLHRDGRIDFGRPVLAFRSARLQESGHFDAGDVLDREDHLVVLANADDVAAGRAPREGASQVQVVPTGTVTVLPERRLLDAVRVRVLEQVGPARDAYVDALAETEHRRRVEVLPGLLDRLWDDGIGLDGRSRHDTPAERRAAALDYWSRRADTPEGREISGVVEQWLRQVVQASEHPVTDAERARAQAARPDGRLLDLGGGAR